MEQINRHTSSSNKNLKDLKKLKKIAEDWFSENQYVIPRHNERSSSLNLLNTADSERRRTSDAVEEKKKAEPEKQDIPASEIVSENLKKRPKKEKPLEKVDAVRVLKKLESVNIDDLTPDEKKLLNHPSFKGYRSTYLEKFKRNFNDIVNELREGIHISLDDFYKQCNSPSQYYKKYLINSLKHACNVNKGCFYDKCNPKKLKIGKKKIDGNKVDIIFLFSDRW